MQLFVMGLGVTNFRTVLFFKPEFNVGSLKAIFAIYSRESNVTLNGLPLFQLPGEKGVGIRVKLQNIQH